jgi:hypothetical protein
MSRGAFGIGLAKYGYANYAPAQGFLDAAFAVADAIESDRYSHSEITVAYGLPTVWFRHADEHRVETAIAAVRATIALHSQPREPAGAGSQMLLVFLSECANDVDAELLATAARPVGDDAYAVAQRGPFLATLIARSIVVGVAQTESDDSLQRFLPALERALKSLAPNTPSPPHQPRE